MAALILRRLADGLDIATGEPLPPESQYNRPDAVRALFAGVEALEAKEEGPAKAGGAWTPEEELRVVEAFDGGTPIKEIAAAHERTPGAIRSRLVKLGKIDSGSDGKGDQTAPVSVNPKPADDIPF